MIRRNAFAGLALAVALAAPAWAPADPPAADLFYQRAVMTAADGACRLFPPDLSATLAAAKAQARGAALRSGAEAVSLDAIEARADGMVRSAGCRSPDIALAADRVRQAFQGYAHLDSMNYPGDEETWQAARPADDGVARWRLSERVRFGWDVLVFGVVGKGAGRPLMAVANFADGQAPYGARLVLRDAAVTVGPFLDPRHADLTGRIPLEDRLPPRSAARVFEAEAVSPAGVDLRPADLADGWAFRFPAEAEAALAALDPREAVAVEFLFPGDAGESVRTAYVEVGDFAAGRSFEEIAQR